MSKADNHIDELFRSGLENASLTPPPGVWEAVSAGLSSSAAGTTVATVSWLKSVWLWVGLGVAAVAGTGVYLSMDSNQPQDAVSVTKELGNLDKEEKNTGNAGEIPAADMPDEPEVTARSGNSEDPGSKGSGEVAAGHKQDHTERSGGEVHSHTHAPAVPPAAEKHTPSPVVEKPGAGPAAGLDCRPALTIKAEQQDSRTWAFQAGGAAGEIIWNFGDGSWGSGMRPVHTYKDQTGNYLVRAYTTTVSGCRDSALLPVTVIIAGQEEVFIPDFLTPNGDGANDELLVRISGTDEYNLVVFDKNNRQIFVSNDPAKGWNGKCGLVDCAAGYYTAILSYRMKGSAERKVLKNRVLLKRE